MFELNKEKYIQIAKDQGLNAALTQLHRDSSEWEFDTFEGAEGWQPPMYDKLKIVRDFSRELWNMELSGELKGTRGHGGKAS